MASLGIVLDVLMVLLLGAVLAYAVILNRRLSQLRSNKDELARVINAFNEATQRAEASIPRLRKTADDIRTQLEDRIEKAVSLKDDLAFMIDRSDSMANRLESSVRMARGETMGGQQATPPAPSPRLPSAPRTMAAARPASSFSPPPSPPQASRPSAPPPRPAAAPAPAQASPPQRREPRLDDSFRMPPDDMDDRSEAERALLRALQSAR
ncbi:conserved exported hypothetical protein [Rhodospirillaceae bacterium LM-1]|nr:conserved exported hypothetical protein [Rhodospirillaceae bacterium LM-1]